MYGVIIIYIFIHQYGNLQVKLYDPYLIASSVRYYNKSAM